MSLPLLFRKKARQRSHVKNYRSARFFTAYLTTSSHQTPLLRFPPDGEKLLCGVAAPLPPKGTAALIAKNGRSARFFAKRLPTTFVRLSALRRFFSVKRSSLRSERRRSEVCLREAGGFGVFKFLYKNAINALRGTKKEETKRLFFLSVLFCFV